jgi:3-oxoacyl-[acyl-carrier-protein] synthase-1
VEKEIWVELRVLMSQIHIISENIISALGFSTSENQDTVLKNVSGIKSYENTELTDEKGSLSLVDSDLLEKEFAGLGDSNAYTRLEKIILVSVSKTFNNIDFRPGKKTGFIFSSTKGNIDLMYSSENTIDKKRAYLWNTAQLISKYFGIESHPYVISNACISGVVAINTASQLIQSGVFDDVVVCGADVASKFVISGFQSFKALSPEPCKPFDENRDGISLGEGVGTVILSRNKLRDNDIVVKPGISTNDANHISGPSRTGDGLFAAIDAVIKNNNLTGKDINYVSSHGTATPYNDEMEAKALASAGVENAPLNSMKSYIGHTLGAAGIIETILAAESMKQGIIAKSLNYTDHGVSIDLNILKENIKQDITHTLKTASGFGGCNAALILEKQ